MTINRERFYLHWLLHAYETLNRGQWEGGYTDRELSDALLDVLCNAGLHPTDDKREWDALLREKMTPIPPPAAGHTTSPDDLQHHIDALRSNLHIDSVLHLNVNAIERLASPKANTHRR